MILTITIGHLLKEGILLESKKNKELSKYVDYWNLVLYYLRKIVYENEAL